MSQDGYKSLTDAKTSNRADGALLHGFGWGVAAALIVGAMEGVGVLVADTYPVKFGRGFTLMALDALGTAGLVALPLGVCAVISRRAGLGWSRQAGAFVGLYLAAMAGFSVAWFVGPAPHVATHGLHGNPWVYMGVAGVGLGVALALGRWVAERRGMFFFLMGMLLVFLHLGTHPQLRRLPAPVDSSGQRPSVVMITIDTIRADHVGRYSTQSPSRTAGMDKLAEQGAVFMDAYAQIPVTGPSHLTMMTGVGPWEHGVLLNGMPVPSEVRTLAERFQERGYRTGAFVSAFVLQGQTGFDRGFEVYDDDFGLLPGWQDTLIGRAWSALQRRFDPHLVLERTAGQTVERAIEWMDQDDGRPVFLWVHLFDPHGPYEPPSPWAQALYEGTDPRDPSNDSMDVVSGVAAYMLPSLVGIRDLQWVLAQYAGEISYTDEQLWNLVQRLDGQADSADTVLVVAGDHGESLGEHGIWFNHGGDLQEPEVRVPLFIRYPPIIPHARMVDGPVELTDLAPTIAAITGLDAEGMGGVSLLPAIAQSRSMRRFARSLCYDRPANLAARAAGEISSPTFTVASLRAADARFELRTAPGTEPRMWRGVRDQETVVANPLQDEDWPADAFTDLMGANIGDGSSRDEATLEKLRALGYVQ